jgi:hypothetical protein
MAMFARPLLATLLLLPAFLLSAASAADSKSMAPVTFSRALSFPVATVACYIPRVRSCTRSIDPICLGPASSVRWTSAWIWVLWMRASGWDLAGAVG